MHPRQRVEQLAPHAARTGSAFFRSTPYRRHTCQHSRPALLLNLLVDRRPQVHLRQHLRQHPVAQPQRRVAESLQPEPLQQTRIHHRAADNDLRPLRPDPGHRRPLRVVHLHQPVGKPPHLSPSSPGPSRLRHAQRLRQRLARGASAACLPVPAPRSPPPAPPPSPRSQSPGSPAASPSFFSARFSSRSMILLQPRNILLRRRIRPQELLLQPHRAQRQAHHLLDVARRPTTSPRSFRRPGRSAAPALALPAHPSPPPGESAAPLPAPRSPPRSTR